MQNEEIAKPWGCRAFRFWSRSTLARALGSAAVALWSATAAQSGTLTAKEQEYLARVDEYKCDWLQAYTDYPIEACTLQKGEMVVIPARRLSRAQAVDLAATAAVAAEMNRRSPHELSVVLSPSWDRYIRIRGNPVRFNGETNRRKALADLSAAAVDCTVKDWVFRCKGEEPQHLIPVK